MATFANPATAASAVASGNLYSHYIPSKTPYEIKEEARSQKLKRFEDSRRVAKEVNNKKQERYRAAMVASVEQELFRRKAVWEAQRNTQLATLRALYAQSMVMLGQAQKSAVNVLTSDAETARVHAKAWETLASVSLARGVEAAVTEDTDRQAGLLNNDTAIYRAEVQRAAALHERRLARRASASTTTRPAGGGGEGEGGGGGERNSSHHHPPPPRESPFYGPNATNQEGVIPVPGGKVIITSALARVPQAGPADFNSVIRVPIAKERTTQLGRDSEESGTRSGAKAAAALARQRKDEGNRSIDRESAATRRGSNAGRVLRETREAVNLLKDLERLDAENRLLSTRTAAAEAAADALFEKQAREQRRSSRSTTPTAIRSRSESVSVVTTSSAKNITQQQMVTSATETPLLPKESEHDLEDVFQDSAIGDAAAAAIETRLLDAQTQDRFTQHLINTGLSIETAKLSADIAEAAAKAAVDGLGSVGRRVGGGKWSTFDGTGYVSDERIKKNTTTTTISSSSKNGAGRESANAYPASKSWVIPKDDETTMQNVPSLSETAARGRRRSGGDGGSEGMSTSSSWMLAPASRGSTTRVDGIPRALAHPFSRIPTEDELTIAFEETLLGALPPQE